MSARYASYPPYLKTDSLWAWCLLPNIVYTYVVPNSHVSSADTEAMVSRLSYVRLQEIFPADAFVFLHDWAHVTSYDAAVRSLAVGWGMSYPKAAIEKIRVLASPTSSTLFRMSAATGTLTLSLLGYDIAVVDSFDDDLGHKIPFLPAD